MYFTALLFFLCSVNNNIPPFPGGCAFIAFFCLNELTGYVHPVQAALRRSAHPVEDRRNCPE